MELLGPVPEIVLWYLLTMVFDAVLLLGFGFSFREAKRCRALGASYGGTRLGLYARGFYGTTEPPFPLSLRWWLMSLKL